MYEVYRMMSIAEVAQEASCPRKVLSSLPRASARFEWDAEVRGRGNVTLE